MNDYDLHFLINVHMYYHFYFYIIIINKYRTQLPRYTYIIHNYKLYTILLLIIVE